MAPIFIIIIALIQAILAFAHFLVYKTLVSVFSISTGPTLTALRIVFAILAVSFVASSVASFRFYNPAVSVFYTVTAVWLGFLLYLFLAACLYWLGVVVLGWLAPLASTALLGHMLLVLAVLVGIYGVANNLRLVITPLIIQLPSLPAELVGKKVVWVSDIHLGQIYSVSFLDKIVAKIQTLKPDMILVGGDVYDGGAFPTDSAIPVLAKLQAPLGTYFITGNHEEFGDNAKYLTAIRAAGITILNNEKIDVHGLQLIGVDYNDTTSRSNYESIIKSLAIDKNKPSILLKHAPTALDIAEQTGVNFQISGHTHRAQMWPLNFITWLVYKGFDFGLHNFGRMTVYTSSGVGTWGPPLRVGSPSEIVLIELK